MASSEKHAEAMRQLFARQKAEAREFADASIVNTKCGKCGQSFEGPLYEGREWFSNHGC